MNIEKLWAMILVTSAFSAVVARDIPPGPDLEVDDIMIAEDENFMDYWNYTAKLNTHTVRSNGLENIQCDFDGQYMEHPTCCYKFVQCSWSTPKEHTCGPDTAWSQSKLTCDHNHNTNCGPRPPKDNQIAQVSPPPPAACSCGMANTKNRIIGGVTVNPKRKYPWQVGLWKSGYYFKCGGSIINSKFILTAAHCFYDNGCDYNPNKISHVHIGEYDQDSTTEDNVGNNKRISVKKIIIHPCYNCKQTNYPNDFALVELEDTIVFNGDNRPVCLPDDDSKTYAGEDATVAGWGDTTYNGDISPTLLELDVTIIDNNNCELYWANDEKILPNHLCAHEPNTWAKNICDGDSGSPVVVEDSNSRYVQVGVASFTPAGTDSNGQAIGCNVPGYPGVYGRVSKVLAWIKENSASGQYCIN